MTANVLLLTVLLFSSFTFVDYEVGPRKAIGTWEYSVPDAPYEYQKGDLIIEKKEGKLEGYTMVNDYKTPVEKVKVKGNKLTFLMYLEGEDISFDITLEKKTFKGIISFSQGELEITGKKKK